MTYLFDPDHWRWLGAGKNLEFLLSRFLVNLEIAVICMILSLIVGLFLALARLSKNRAVSIVAGTWIDVWRNLPLIFILLYGLLSLPENLADAWVRAVPDFFPDALQSRFALAGILGLTVYNSAVLAEIMRAGIKSLERGQGEAAAALGLPYWRSMRLIILPQGLRRMVPATVSQLITLNKDTTLLFIINIQEVMKGGRIVTATSDNPFVGLNVEAPLLQVFVFIGGLFVIVNLALSRLSRRLEIRERARTGTTTEKVSGLEDQVALQSDVA